MEQIKLAALRDFAINHLPRAQRTRSQNHSTPDSYHLALYGIAALALTSATAPAVEQAAARLLQLTMSLSINWEPANQPSARQRHDTSHQTIAAATDLCTLTGSSLPWLTDTLEHEAPPPAPAGEPAAEPSKRRPAPPPGVNLTTEEAAEYLNMEVQTLHKWSCQDSGPIRPIRINRRLHWPSNEVIRVMQGK